MHFHTVKKVDGSHLFLSLIGYKHSFLVRLHLKIKFLSRVFLTYLIISKAFFNIRDTLYNDK